MKKITWEINESFVFPEIYGKPTSLNKVKITPRWEQQEDELSVSLTGIYHIAANVEFDDTQEVLQQLENESTLVDEVDVEGNEGYFEYAIPLNVSLPNDKIDQSTVVLNAKNLQTKVSDNGICVISCQVDCEYSNVEEKEVVEAPRVEAQSELVQNEEVQVAETEKVVQLTTNESPMDLLEKPIVVDQDESILSQILWDLEEHYSVEEIPLNNVRM
ncbi:hypothetical protein [Rummeliibacillus sp. TYF-LIM-RU47]|uniref:hypothetical protein n=1 Tax=Rummeliibacillus sp. TYF-LIM-RU47 TaxID=2608406 RepID=UPI001239B22B|nr:hypothetical protein [Rummeliibacillus sp. TYF-LIM-RU47]